MESNINKSEEINISEILKPYLKRWKWFIFSSILFLVLAYFFLKTQKPVYTSYSNGIKSTYRNYYDTQFFTISLSYKFGNHKLKVSKHNFGNQEEKNRTGK